MNADEGLVLAGALTGLSMLTVWIVFIVAMMFKTGMI